MTKETITFNDAIAGLNILKPVRGGHRAQSILDELTGDAAVKKYFLAGDIEDAFEGQIEYHNELLDKRDKLQEQNTKLKEERSELVERRERNKTGLSKKDSERLKAIDQELEEADRESEKISDELDDLLQQEEEVTLTRGKFRESEIKQAANGIVHEVFGHWAIEYDAAEES